MSSDMIKNKNVDCDRFQGLPFKFSFQRPKTPIGVIALMM